MENIPRIELIQVAEAVAREKLIDKEDVIVAMEDAIQRAARSKYGLERDISFEHAVTGKKITIPLDDNTLYAFTKDINIEWKHGIPQVPPDKYIKEGRISIIAWGYKHIDE